MRRNVKIFMGNDRVRRIGNEIQVYVNDSIKYSNYYNDSKRVYAKVKRMIENG